MFGQIQNSEVNNKTITSPRDEIVNHRSGRRVQLPLHQPILWPQLQHFTRIKEEFERRPAVVLLRLEDDRQLKRRGDTLVWEHVPNTFEAVFAVHVDLDGCSPDAAGFVNRGRQHIPANPGGHTVRQQQHLAMEAGRLGLRQTAF